MELKYDKKDISKSPKAKAEKSLPEGWELYEKRGMWHLVGDTHEIFTSKELALEWLNK
jgi:hypothetical protein